MGPHTLLKWEPHPPTWVGNRHPTNIPQGEAGTLLFPSVMLMALDPLQRRMLGKRKRGKGMGASILSASTLSPSLRQCLQTGGGEGFILARAGTTAPRQGITGGAEVRAGQPRPSKALLLHSKRD